MAEWMWNLKQLHFMDFIRSCFPFCSCYTTKSNMTFTIVFLLFYYSKISFNFAKHYKFSTRYHGSPRHVHIFDFVAIENLIENLKIILSRYIFRNRHHIKNWTHQTTKMNLNVDEKDTLNRLKLFHKHFPWKFCLIHTYFSDVRTLKTNKHFINANTPNVRKTRWRRENFLVFWKFVYFY